MESEIAVQAGLKLLDRGIRDDTCPLDAAVEGQEVVQIKLYGDIAFDGNGVALEFAQLELVLELDFIIDGEDARMNRTASATFEQILSGSVLVFAALCCAGGAGSRKVAWQMRALVVAIRRSRGCCPLLRGS